MFHSARLKLTAWYLLIIMSISIMFSVVIYEVLTNEVRRFERIQRFRIEHRLLLSPLPSFSNPELVKEIEERILIRLMLINFSILVISGGLGYFLAGRTLKPIKQMVDEQNRFVSDASHELRTPLTSLKSAFEVYLRNKNQTLPEAATLMQESIREVNTLQSLSESLLQLTHYQGPDGHLEFKKIQLQDIVEEAVRKIEPLAKQKNISIKSDSQKVHFYGNRYGLIDLVVILLDNAVKYSFRGTTVHIRTKKTDHTIYISVSDKGIGISEKDLPHIFDRFYRADSARTKKDSGGYGLGLSIAKKITDIYHGSIDVKSTLKIGSTFIVRLPIKH